MLIGELAKKINISIDTIRYYEGKGLVKPVSIRKSGYREFDERAVERLNFIIRAKDLGFSLKEILNLVELRDNPNTKCSKVQELSKQKLDDVSSKIKELQKIEMELKKLVEQCSGGNEGLEKCPIVKTLGKS